MEEAGGGEGGGGDGGLMMMVGGGPAAAGHGHPCCPPNNSNNHQHQRQHPGYFFHQQQSPPQLEITGDALLSAKTLAAHEDALRFQQRRIGQLQHELALSQDQLRRHQQVNMVKIIFFVFLYL